MKKALVIFGIFLSLLVFNVSNLGAASTYYFATVDKVGVSDRPEVRLIAKNGSWSKWCIFPTETAKESLATALTALSLGKDVYVYLNAAAATPVVWEIFVCD